MKRRLTQLMVVAFVVFGAVLKADSLRNSVPGSSDGLLVEYYERTNADYLIPDFTQLTPYADEVRTSLWFYNETGNILGSQRADYLAVRMSGYVDVPADGLYTFYTTADDGDKLLIDGNMIIDKKFADNPEKTFSIRLKGGVHAIEIQYAEYTGSAGLEVQWDSDGFSKKPLTSADLWYSPNSTPELVNALAQTKDSDMDGIVDVDEQNIGTNANLADTDADGLSDYDEYFIYNTNPLSVDSDGDSFSDYEEITDILSDPNTADISNQIVDAASLRGADGTVKTGDWMLDGNSLYAVGLNGSVEYSMNVPADGVYRINASISEHNPYSTAAAFTVSLFLDNDFFSKTAATLDANENANALFMLTNLSAGQHSFILQWNNIAYNTSLEINSLKLQKLNGPDNDGNGVPDWLDNRNAKLKVLSVPAASPVSPVCVEGDNHLNIGTMSISGYYIDPNDDDPPPPELKHLPDNKWYADVPLSPNDATPLSFNYSDGPVAKVVTWSETNAFTASDMSVRLNDSLLISAYPQGAVSGTSVIEIDGQSFTVAYNSSNPRNSIAYKFENHGDFVVNASYTPDDNSGTVTASFNVKVVSAHFSGTPIAVVHTTMDWTNSDFDQDAVVVADSSLTFSESVNPDSRVIRYSLQKNAAAYLAARLGASGPVLDSGEIKPFNIVVNPMGLMKLVDTFSDGSILLENTISIDNIPDDMEIVLDLLTAGALFEDGTTTMTVTKDDFDQYGTLTYRIIRLPYTNSSACHFLTVKQGGRVVYSY